MKKKAQVNLEFWATKKIDSYESRQTVTSQKEHKSNSFHQVRVLETDTFGRFYKIQSSECRKVHSKIANLILTWTNSVSLCTFPSSDHLKTILIFKYFSLKWTSTVTRNTIFLQSKPYLQKFLQDGVRWTITESQCQSP